MMLRVIAFVVTAGPAFAHHEAVVVSFLPTLMIWAAAVAVGGLAAWRRWRSRHR